MGTRADFYYGGEWLGSIAWDGYPEALRSVKGLFSATTGMEWQTAVAALLADREDATTPDMGWPWPWDDSTTTDYAYVFRSGGVSASNFGGYFFDPRVSDEPELAHPAFPDMASRRNLATAGSERSGVVVA